MSQQCFLINESTPEQEIKTLVKGLHTIIHKHFPNCNRQFWHPRFIKDDILNAFYVHEYFNGCDHSLASIVATGFVWIKKYFYVLRPLLAIRWIEMRLGIVPTEFEKLVYKAVDD